MEKGFDIINEFLPLYEDLVDLPSYPDNKPLLAHYTSIENLERIMTTDEVWFSNPLFMNDIEELRFGFDESIKQFRNNDEIRKACGSIDRYDKLVSAFNDIYNKYKYEQEIDIYVLCLSKHKIDNNDGILSMWRGYGGNGNGAAIVIDTEQFTNLSSSPLILSVVKYQSTEARLKRIKDKLSQFANLLESHNLPDNYLDKAASVLFLWIKLFALLTKHHGFREEQEWRVIYLKEKDVDKRLERYCQYAVCKRGLEPKLKVPVGPIEGVTGGDHNLVKITHKIILGPMVTGPPNFNT